MKRDPMPSAFDWAIIDDRERGIFRVNRKVFLDEDVFERSAGRSSSVLALCRARVGAGGEQRVHLPHGRRPAADPEPRPAGKLHAFFNSCPHRGAMVCREPKGRARNFTCPYHGWVFSDEGRAIHRPLPESYSPACAEDESLHLRPVPRFEVFAGFIFVNYSPTGESLADYLAGAGDYLQMIGEQDEDGMVIVGGAQTYSARANWKLLQENSADGYHADTTHSTYFEYIRTARHGQEQLRQGLRRAPRGFRGSARNIQPRQPRIGGPAP